MQTFADLIVRFGGAAKLAVEIDVSASAIRQWSARGSIPVRYWQSIIAAASRLGVDGVTAATLAEMASHQSAA